MHNYNSNHLSFECCKQSLIRPVSQSGDMKVINQLTFSNIEGIQKNSLDYEVIINQPQHFHQDFSFYKLMKYNTQNVQSLNSRQTECPPKSLEYNQNNELIFQYSVSEVQQYESSGKVTTYSRSRDSSKPNFLAVPPQKEDRSSKKSLKSSSRQKAILQQSQKNTSKTNSIPLKKLLTNQQATENISSPQFSSLPNQDLTTPKKHQIKTSDFSFRDGLNTFQPISSKNQTKPETFKSLTAKKQNKKISISKQKKKIQNKHNRKNKVFQKQQDIFKKLTVTENVPNIQTPMKSSIIKTVNLSTDRTFTSNRKTQNFDGHKKLSESKSNNSTQKKFSPINNYIIDSFCCQNKPKTPGTVTSKSNTMEINDQKKPVQLKNLITYKKEKIQQATKNCSKHSILSSKTNENTISILNYGLSRQFENQIDFDQDQLLKTGLQLLKTINMKVTNIQNKLIERQQRQKEQLQQKNIQINQNLLLSASKRIVTSKHSPGVHKNLRNYAASVVSNLTTPPQQDAISHIQPLNSSNSDFIILKNCQNNAKMFEDLIKIHTQKQQTPQTFVCDRSYHVNPDSAIHKIQVIEQIEQNLNSTIKNSKHSSDMSVSKHEKSEQSSRLPFLTMSPFRFSQSMKQENIFVPRTSLVKVKQKIFSETDEDEMFPDFKPINFIQEDQEWYSASGGFQNVKNNKNLQLQSTKSKLKQGLNIFIEVAQGLSIIAKCKQISCSFGNELPFSIIKIFKAKHIHENLLHNYMLHPAKFSSITNEPSILYSVSQYYQEPLLSYLERNCTEIFFQAIKVSVVKQLIEAILNIVPFLQKLSKTSQTSEQQVLRYVWKKLKLKHAVILFEIVKIDLILMLFDPQITQPDKKHKTIINQILYYQQINQTNLFSKRISNSIQMQIPRNSPQPLSTITNLDQLRQFYMKEFVTNAKNRIKSNCIQSQKIL